MIRENHRVNLPDGFRYSDNHKLIVPIAKEQKLLTPSIRITGYVDDKLVESVSRQLDDLNEKTNIKSVDVTLSSTGGNVYYGFAVHDLLAVFAKRQKIDVNITAFGPVMSMGSLILQAGSKRSMSRNAEMLIHPFTQKTEFPVYVDTLEADVEHLKEMNSRYYKVLARRSQIAGGDLTTDKVKDMALTNQNSGTYLSAEAALGSKLIDEIV